MLVTELLAQSADCRFQNCLTRARASGQHVLMSRAVPIERKSEHGAIEKIVVGNGGVTGFNHGAQPVFGRRRRFERGTDALLLNFRNGVEGCMNNERLSTGK